MSTLQHRIVSIRFCRIPVHIAIFQKALLTEDFNAVLCRRRNFQVSRQ